MRPNPFLLLLICLLTNVHWSSAQNAWLHPELEKIVQENQRERVRIGIYLHEQVNAPALKVQMAQQKLDANERAKAVIKAAYALQNSSQKPFIARLHGMSEEIEIVHAFWLANILIVDVPLSLVPRLQRMPEVFWLFADESFETGLIEPTEIEVLEHQPEVVNGREPGLNVINAPALWALGYTGRNRKAFTVDTGTWTDHPALKHRFLGNYRPLSEGWFSLESKFPVDRPSHHGTHVNGTILGLDTATNDTIGAAFNAYFMASNPLTHSNLTPLSINLLSFEWAMNPDGDTSTTNDIPDVINNSWGQAGAADTSICVSWATQIFDMVEAAGVAIVFSAGNEGPGPSTVKHPQFVNTNDVNIFSIGAIDGNSATLPIANFSSRGPSLCGGTGSLLVKPEVVAPGVNVRSAYGKTGYANLSGTSMSSPHVSGAIVLLKEAFPNLGGDSLMYALYQSAIDMGDTGEDNTFGRGRIDVLAAFNYLSNNHTPVPPRTGYDLAVQQLHLPVAESYCTANFPNGLTAQLRLSNKGDSSISTATIDYRTNNGSWQTVNFSGVLAVGTSSANIALPGIPLQPGWNELQVRSRIPGVSSEIDEINNFRSLSFYVLATDTLVINNNPSTYNIRAEHFVPDSSVRIIDRDKDDISWDTVTVVGLMRDSKAFVMRHGNYGARQRQQDDLVTRQYFGGTGSLEGFEALSFSLAYRNRNTAFRDSLRITVECDCGANVRTLYYSGGDSMKTYAAGTAPTDSSHWRSFEFRNLSLVSGPCFVRFRTINDFGGNLYIGDMTIRHSTSSSVQSLPQSQVNIYPNPFSSLITVASEEGDWLESIEIMDVAGRRLFFREQLQITRLEVQTDFLPSGLYLLRAKTARGSVVKRLVKQ
jgi:subtilisin family serine protease